MKKWKKRGDCNNLEEYIQELHHTSMKEFSTKQKQYQIPVLARVANALIWARDHHVLVDVVGDYDCDGICGTSILANICGAMGISYTLTVPKRISEGYGLSSTIVERLKGQLLITIDNGISSKEAIQLAKENGKFVLILDHHLAPVDENGIPDYPKADVIIDPNAIDQGETFKDYCGAGLGYKLAELLFQGQDDFLDYLSTIAAIGTIGDVVSLTEDNRQIVKRGITALKNNKGPRGLHHLMELQKMHSYFNATDLAYKIVPVLNAPGRLDDEGGELSLSLLLEREEENSLDLAKEMMAINEQRKEIVANAMNEIEREEDARSCVYYKEEITEGILGVIAGKLAEEMQGVAFAFTKTKEGILKGSGRCSLELFHLKEFLDCHKDLLVKYGGHKGAAGVSLEEKNLKEFAKCLEEEVKVVATEKAVYYDLEITDAEATQLYRYFPILEPFGEGNPKPVVRLKGMLGDRLGNTVKVIGKEKNHLQLSFQDFKGICFGGAKQYEENPTKLIDAIGTLEPNFFNDRLSMQFQIQEF